LFWVLFRGTLLLWLVSVDLIIFGLICSTFFMRDFLVGIVTFIIVFGLLFLIVLVVIVFIIIFFAFRIFVIIGL
jgi:hypothetical protein